MSSTPLANMTVEEFLANYWQKKPVLIRQAFPNFQPPLEPDELAGLALQEGVLSRLIMEKGGDYPWQLKHGPLPEDTFDDLGDEYWTLLVQEVDRHVPEVADLFDRFHFLPSWRKDDVMVSFAARHAGVGAHIDSYDVFLLQGSGKRRWEIGRPGAGTAPADGGIRANHSASQSQSKDYIEGLDVRILADFEPVEAYDLEPGDMLYLPPCVPHNGVAIEPCLTFSFGFLAPSRADMVSDFGHWYEENHEIIRYGDPDLLEGRKEGLITNNDLNRVLRVLQQTVIERDDLARWFGTFITRPQRGPADTEEFEGTFDDFVQDFEEAGTWRRHEGVRMAGWVDGKPRLFVEGEEIDHDLDGEAITRLTSNRCFSHAACRGRSDFLRVLYQLTKNGRGYLVSTQEESH